MKVKQFKEIINTLPEEDEIFIKEFVWIPKTGVSQ